MAARPVHDRHQAEEATAHRDGGDVGAPDMVRPLTRHALHKIGPHPVLGVRVAGARRPVERLKTQQAYQPSHLPGAVERRLQEPLVDRPHPRQRLRALPLRRVVQRRAPDRQLPELALVSPAMALDTVREHLSQPLDRLALPGPHLVRVNLMLRGDLLQGPLATKRLKRDLRLLLSRKSPALAAHLHASLSRWNTP